MPICRDEVSTRGKTLDSRNIRECISACSLFYPPFFFSFFFFRDAESNEKNTGRNAMASGNAIFFFSFSVLSSYSNSCNFASYVTVRLVRSRQTMTSRINENLVIPAIPVLEIDQFIWHVIWSVDISRFQVFLVVGPSAENFSVRYYPKGRVFFHSLFLRKRP